jgi:radical SAM superfamily enzyme YgiQ (UPF0313 family)
LKYKEIHLAMLALINTNRMQPPIAPIGLDYVATAVRQAGFEAGVFDLCLANVGRVSNLPGQVENLPHAPQWQVENLPHDTELVGLTFRNVDDCFWPSGASFVPDLVEAVAAVRRNTAAPIVLGGVGYSVFARRLVEETGADFGIRGDGEQAIVELLRQLRAPRQFDRVPGLVWHQDGVVRENIPAWPRDLAIPTTRNAIDNAAYFRLGGQIGVETKRGCNRACAYCIDPLAKGPTVRRRSPAEVADEVESLLGQGVDVLHLCDAEFNVPIDHAREVCDELISRGLGRRVRWYAYLAVVPFDDGLAARMARAGCAGINFTSDAAAAPMLAVYRQAHGKEDLARAVRLCRDHGMAVMLDSLLGGPGETPETLAETVRFFQHIGPDCVGASLGIRLYPGTAMTAMLAAQTPLELLPGLRRHYSGPVDLLRPTFYISPLLGRRPAQLVRDLIGDDPRFFGPEDETLPGEPSAPQKDHNYNANQALVEAIRGGARGAYWDILRREAETARPAGLAPGPDSSTP